MLPIRNRGRRRIQKYADGDDVTQTSPELWCCVREYLLTHHFSLIFSHSLLLACNAYFYLGPTERKTQHNVMQQTLIKIISSHVVQLK